MSQGKKIAYIQVHKERLIQEVDGLEKEQFKKQIVLLQDYYQKDGVRNKVKDAFTALWGNGTEKMRQPVWESTTGIRTYITGSILIRSHLQKEQFIYKQQ